MRMPVRYRCLFEHRPSELWGIAGFAFQRFWAAPSPAREHGQEDFRVRGAGGFRGRCRSPLAPVAAPVGVEQPD